MPTFLHGCCVYCHARMHVQTLGEDPLVTCSRCGREMLASEAAGTRRGTRKSLIWLSIGVLAIIGMAELGYRYRTPLAIGFDFLVDQTGSMIAAIGAIGAGLIVFLCLVSWLIFPILMIGSLRKLRRRALALEETTRLCARHLARLARERPAAVGAQLSKRSSSNSTEMRRASDDGLQDAETPRES